MEQSDLGLIQKFKAFLGSYMDSLAIQEPKTKPKQRWDHHRKMVLENSYHLTSKRYSRKEMSFLFGLTEERVRQINNETVAAISARITEVNSDIFTCYYLEDLKKLDSYLQKERVWPQRKFYDYLSVKYQIDIEQERPYVHLIADVLGYRISKNPYSQIKDNEFIFFDQTIDRNIFFKICHSIFVVLEENTIPVNLKDVTVNVRKDLNLLPKDRSLIGKAINMVADFETVAIKPAKLYQIAFHRLSSSADMANRVLFEQGNWMKFSEISDEIHRRLGSKNKRVIDPKSIYVAMKNDQRLLPLGKSGIWTLAKWGENDRGMCEVITNTLLQFNEPLSKEQIFAQILTTHPFMPIDLFNLSINNRKFAHLRDKRIILAEWKYLHKKGKVINKTIKQVILASHPNMN
jgi:hypothetical protein